MSGTLTDQIQSQQIQALQFQVEILQQQLSATGNVLAGIATMQAQIVDIQKQLLNGPPNFSTWPVTAIPPPSTGTS